MWYNWNAMAAQLSDELRREIEHQGDRPVEVVDPATNKVYLLIPREQYDKLKPLFENEPLSNLEQRELLRQAGRRAGWDEPAMDAYDHYDEHRAQKP
jgi:hypothetical protein